MKRRALKLILFLFAGAIVNVAVAWSCGRWSPISSFEERNITDADQHWLAANGEHAASYESASQDGAFAEWHTVSQFGGFGIRVEHFDLHSPELIASQKRLAEEQPFMHVSWASYSCELTKAGWPIHSLSAERWAHTPEWTENASDHGIEVKGGWPIDNAAYGQRLLPWRPIWPGIAINTIFYAGLLWVLFLGPGKVRRMLLTGGRRRRGLCPACAYDLRGSTSPVCTECGKPV